MAATGWIKCDEKLPEKNGRYLATIDTVTSWGLKLKYVAECEFRKRLCEIRYDWPDEHGWFHRWAGEKGPDEYIVKDVTHWMPLPELPEN